MRLFTRNGYDWSDRYPLIVEAALRNRQSNFVIDGEAVLLGVDGISDFDGLHSRKHDEEIQFFAFDMLVSDGADIRKLPLSIRKVNLSRLLARRVDGIFEGCLLKPRGGFRASAFPHSQNERGRQLRRPLTQEVKYS